MSIGRPPKIHEKEYGKIVQLYLSGSSLTKIGNKFNVAKDTIKLILRKNNIHVRNSEEVNERWRYDSNKLKFLYLNNRITIKEVALVLGSGYKAVRKALIREGVHLRNRSSYKRPHTEETCDKIRRTKIGEKNPNYRGKSCTESTKNKLRLIRLGTKLSKNVCDKISNTRKIRGLSKGSKNPMSNPVNVSKWAKSNRIKPNKKELKVIGLLNSVLPGEYLINVTGEHLILNCKIPDFVCIQKRKIIEFYGDYWHKGENGSERIDEFKKFGYDTLIIWEKDLKNVTQVLDSVLSFHKRQDNAYTPVA